ncbi:hypothetical protein M8494_09015 [Serratia ureilytica]
MPSGKAEFSAAALPIQPCSCSWAAKASAVYPVDQRCSHDQYQHHHGGLDDRYRGVYVNAKCCSSIREDSGGAGPADGERVEIETPWNDGVVRADGFKLVSYDIPRGNLAAYYLETNPLVPLGAFWRRYRHANFEVDSVVIRRSEQQPRCARFRKRARSTPGAPISPDGLQLVGQR